MSHGSNSLGIRAITPSLRSEEKATHVALNQSISSVSVSARKCGHEVEIGFLNKRPQTEFALYFLDLPVWLLSLDKSSASRVVICGFESSSALMVFGHLLHQEGPQGSPQSCNLGALPARVELGINHLLCPSGSMWIYWIQGGHHEDSLGSWSYS